MCINLYIKKEDFDSGTDLLAKAFVIPRFKAWCEDCKVKTEVEVMPSLEKIKERIDEVKKKEVTESFKTDYFDESKVYQSGLNQNEKDEELKFNSKFLKWRKQRKSPPKCLECGSENISDKPEDELWDSLGEICKIASFYDYEGNKLS